IRGLWEAASSTYEAAVLSVQDDRDRLAAQRAAATALSAHINASLLEPPLVEHRVRNSTLAVIGLTVKTEGMQRSSLAAADRRRARHLGARCWAGRDLGARGRCRRRQGTRPRARRRVGLARVPDVAIQF